MNDSSEPYLVGVDGGGSGCRAVIGTRVNGILASATGGSANATTNIALAIKNVTGAIRSAAETAGVTSNQLQTATAHIGLAGVVTKDIAATIAAGLPIANCDVTDDCPATAMGALDGADGYVAGIGTGSFIGKSNGGKCKFVGGYGLSISDQASGAWLGRAALVQALKCHDGLDQHSDLTRDLMTRFKNAPSNCIAFARTAQPLDYASFAPDVICAANAGDIHGQQIVQSGTTYIAHALDALGFRKGDTLCMMGGVGPHFAPFMPAQYTNKLTDPKATASHGAFHLARLKGEQLV